MVRRARIFDRSSGQLGIRVLNDVLFTLQTAAAVAAQGVTGARFSSWRTTVLAVPVLRMMRPRRRLVAAVFDIESGLAKRHRAGAPRVRRAAARRRRTLVLNRADAVLVLTPQMQTALAAIGVTRPVHIVPIWPLIKPRAPDDRDPARTLMYSGGLTRRHGAHLLAPFWHHLRRQVPDCRLIVQGDGAARDSIFRELWAVGGHVIVRPSVDRNALASSLAEADLQLVLQAGPAAALQHAVEGFDLSCRRRAVSDQRASRAQPSPMSPWRAVVGASFRGKHRRWQGLRYRCLRRRKSYGPWRRAAIAMCGTITTLPACCSATTRCFSRRRSPTR